LIESVIVIVKSSVPEAGTAEPVAVQTALAISTVGIVVSPEESSREMLHVARPEPDKSVAV
jgi:hypothetical protein